MKCAAKEMIMIYVFLRVKLRLAEELWVLIYGVYIHSKDEKKVYKEINGWGFVYS